MTNPESVESEPAVTDEMVEAFCNEWIGVNPATFIQRNGEDVRAALRAALAVSPELKRLREENARLTAERDEARDYAFEATKAITGIAGGGSECFAGKLGDRYKADLPFCASRIRDRHQRAHEHLLKAVEAKRAAADSAARMREALEKIVEIGSRSYVNRVGDAYDLKHGYTEWTELSPEAEIARAALTEQGGSGA